MYTDRNSLPLKLILFVRLSALLGFRGNFYEVPKRFPVSIIHFNVEFFRFPIGKIEMMEMLGVMEESEIKVLMVIIDILGVVKI